MNKKHEVDGLMLAFAALSLIGGTVSLFLNHGFIEYYIVINLFIITAYVLPKLDNINPKQDKE